jgi:hypothetical protein
MTFGLRYLYRGSLVLSVLLWLATLAKFCLVPLRFDDAYMFYRYAVHMHAGYGMSWNIGGGPVFGETSLLWGWFVWLFSFLPISAGYLLVIASCIWGGLAILSLSASVAMNARSKALRNVLQVLPLVALPLLLTRTLFLNMGTGMETMMSLAVNSLFAGLVLRWSQGKARWPWIALAGVAALLVRPESGLLVVTMPLAAMLLLRRDARGRREAFLILVLFAAGVGALLLGCKLYFGTALPLSFYIKAMHGYEGAMFPSSRPISSALELFGCCVPFLVVLAALVRRTMVRTVVVCAIPLALILLYLLTVLQVMGQFARYDAPYCELIILPALLVLDDALCGYESGQRTHFVHLSLNRCLGLIALILLLTVFSLHASSPRLNDLVLGKWHVYEQPVLTCAASRPLPAMNGDEAMQRIGDDLAKALPAGTSIAATEVGYVGAVAPDVEILDMAGLNDAAIALHGFDSARLLERKPDIIWLPHTDDYTYHRGVLFTDPEL